LTLCLSLILVKEFCNQQFNVESLQFIMEVEAFNSTMKLDLVHWPDPWKDIDEQIRIEKGLSSFEEVILQEAKEPTTYPWPSSQLNEQTVRTDLQEIWDIFISEKATLQICLPNNVYQTTKFRFDHFQRSLSTLHSPPSLSLSLYVLSSLCLTRRLSLCLSPSRAPSRPPPSLCLSLSSLVSPDMALLSSWKLPSTLLSLSEEISYQDSRKRPNSRK
jgi:hypothetical protein